MSWKHYEIETSLNWNWLTLLWWGAGWCRCLRCEAWGCLQVRPRSLSYIEAPLSPSDLFNSCITNMLTISLQTFGNNPSHVISDIRKCLVSFFQQDQLNLKELREKLASRPSQSGLGFLCVRKVTATTLCSTSLSPRASASSPPCTPGH